MKTNDKYRGKYFSVLGDSVSTLYGYSEPAQAVFYGREKKDVTGVWNLSDTWWGQVIERLGGVLLVNHSFSGSTVIRHKLAEIPSYACSDERTSALSRDGVMPDVIMIPMGVNDWGCGARLIPANESDEGNMAIFSVAYGAMLEKLKRNYPASELWCFTLPISACSGDEHFVFPYCYGGRHIEEYCKVIRACAKAYDCRVIDLYAAATPYDTIDGFHPNAVGMKTLADTVLELLSKESKPKIIDSHAHYAHARYDRETPFLSEENGEWKMMRGDREAILAEMRKNGIVGAIEPSISFESIEKQKETVSRYGGYLWTALGVHPTRCIHTPWRKRKALAACAESTDIVAIGETGLDYHHPRREQHRFCQRMWFGYQLKLADRLGLPLILHIREADPEALSIIQRYKGHLYGGVVHCFSGDAALAEQYISLGFAIGIGGKLLCDDEVGKVLCETVKRIPMSAILAETDAPYVLPDLGALACTGKQRKKLCNSSLILPAVIARIAELRGESYEAVANTVYENTVRVFRLNVRKETQGE